jgi:gliding motility-associated-like protein
MLDRPGEVSEFTEKPGSNSRVICLFAIDAMKYYPLTYALLLGFLPLALLAQSGIPTSVTIAGGPCVNNPLSITTPVPATGITWMLNGSTAVSTQTASKTATTTVAGGNGAGAAANQLSSPDRIFAAADGTVYIPDRNNCRVQKWAPGATSGVTVAGGNGCGFAADQLSQPTAVTVDAQGNVYVTDQYSNSVQKWAPGATSGIKVADQNIGLDDPTDLFMDAQGSLYVSNQNGECVYKFSPDFSSHTVVAGIENNAGNGLNQLSSPTGIYVDADGNVYVCDTDNNRVMKWAPGAAAGVVMAGGNGNGDAANQLTNPLDVCVDCQGNLYISDTYNNRIQLWTAGATSGTTIMGSGSGEGEVSMPFSVYLDGNGFVYISDGNNNRIEQYGSTIDRSYTPKTGGVYTAIVNTGCGMLTSNGITISSEGPPELPADSAICPGGQVQLNAGSGYSSYQWQDGTTDSVYTVTGPGTYTVTVTSVCGGPYKATVNVSQDKLPSGFLPADTAYCSYDTLLLRPNVDFRAYLWSDGSTGPMLAVSQPGLYSLQGTDVNGCVVTQQVLVSSKACPARGVYVPTAFTPNGDGRNDVFRPQVFGTVSNYSFAVYTRYGQLVFSSKEPGAGWDGKVGGSWPGSAVFVWYCSFQLAGKAPQLEKGTVVLVR